MGLARETEEVRLPLDSPAPSASEDPATCKASIQSKLQNFGIEATTENIFATDYPAISITRGHGSSSVTIINGQSKVTITGNDSVTHIDGHDIAFRQLSPTSQNDLPFVGIGSTDRATIAWVNVDDNWPTLSPENTGFKPNSLGWLNNRAVVEAELSAGAQAFLIRNPSRGSQDSRAELRPALEKNDRVRSIELNLAGIGFSTLHTSAIPEGYRENQELASAIRQGSALLIIDNPIKAYLGLTGDNDLPSLYRGTNVGLRFSEGAKRIIVVATNAGEPGHSERGQLDIVIQDRDGTLYTRTQTLEGSLSISMNGQGIILGDQRTFDSQIYTKPILSAISLNAIRQSRKEEPSGAMVSETLSSILPYPCIQERRFESVYRSMNMAAGADLGLTFSPTQFTRVDEELHTVGLAGPGDKSAYRCETSNGVICTFSPGTLAPGNYQLLLEFPSATTGTNILAICERFSAHLAAVNHKAAIFPQQKLPNEVQSAFLVFKDPAKIAELIRSLR